MDGERNAETSDEERLASDLSAFKEQLACELDTAISKVRSTSAANTYNTRSKTAMTFGRYNWKSGCRDRVARSSTFMYTVVKYLLPE